MSSARSAAFRVELTDRASLDLESIYANINADNASAAAAWFNGLEATVFSLEHSPEPRPANPGEPQAPPASLRP